MAATTYDINVRYRLEDRASQGAKRLGGELDRTSKKASGLGRAMKAALGAAAIGYGLRTAKKWLIDYNSSLEDTKLAMTGLIQLNLGGSWSSNQKKANSLIEQFKVDARASAGTMQDFAQFAQLIAGPVTRAGMSMKDLRDLTKGGVVAAKAMGMQAEVAARDIEQALAGTLGMKDRFARAILEPMGITTEKWNEMMRETPQLAAQTLTKAFNQPALKKMASQYMDTWSGATSTLKDNLQQTLGKVGLPLMKALVEEVKKMNSYFETNPEKIKEFVMKMSKALVDGFGMVKSAVKFIVNNAGTIMNLAKAFIGFKLITGVGGILSGGLMGLAKFDKSLGLAAGSATGFANAAGGAVGKLQGIVGVLGAVYVGAKFIANQVDKRQEEELERVSGRPQAFLSMAEGRNIGTGVYNKRAKLIASAESAGLIQQGQIDKAAFATAMAGGKKRWTEKGMQKAFEEGQFGGRGATREERFRTLIGGGLTDTYDPRSLKAFDALKSALEHQNQQSWKKIDEWMSQNASGIKTQIAMQGGPLEYFTSGALGRDLLESTFKGEGPLVTPFNVVTGEGDHTATAKPTKKTGDVKVYINTIKVVGDDPDRFAMRMIGAFRDATAKPVASRLRTPGGRPS